VTIIIGAYSTLEKRLIAAAYYVSNRLDQDTVSLDEISKHFSFEMPARFVRNILIDLNDRGLSKEKIFSGSLGEQRIWLTPSGIREAETIIDQNETDVQNFALDAGSVNPDFVIIKFDKRDQSYLDVSSGLERLRSEIQRHNDVGISGEERDRLIDSLAAASTLWSSAGLKLIQIRIGILLAIEDAGRALGAAGKAVAWETLRDVVVDIVKSRIGISL
jgi:hypothetical protein